LGRRAAAERAASPSIALCGSGTRSEAEGHGSTASTERGWRMRRPGNILLLAILIGALSAALAYRYFRQLRLELEAARGSANRPVVEVVVPSQPITIGSRIEESQVKLVSWPIEAQPDGAFRDMKAVVGSIAVASIDKNEPVLQSQVVAQGAGLLPLMISEGMRGMS